MWPAPVQEVGGMGEGPVRTQQRRAAATQRPRVTRLASQVGDVTVRSGEGIIALNQSANRDEEHFPNPDRFDIRRSPNPEARPVSVGASGLAKAGRHAQRRPYGPTGGAALVQVAAGCAPEQALASALCVAFVCQNCPRLRLLPRRLPLATAPMSERAASQLCPVPGSTQCTAQCPGLCI